MRCEGNSIRATCRITGAAKWTVVRLLVALGTAAADYQDATLRNLPRKRLQADEIWTFIRAKDRTVKRATKPMPADAGDVWTWVAIDRDTKLVPAWIVGKRDAETGMAFMADLASRMAGRVQLTTDGLTTYLDAVEQGFGANVDFAQLVKVYGPPAGAEHERRYSPPVCLGARKHVVSGAPDPDSISTSHVERQNLTMRMQMRRYTRLTNGFSKKLSNHEAAVALHFLHYNFVRGHGSLGGKTPAQAAGVSRYAWTCQDIAALLDDPKYADSFHFQGAKARAKT